MGFASLALTTGSPALALPFPTPRARCPRLTFAPVPIRLTFLAMKPGDHPEFFRFPAPEGRSRESTIRLDPEGHFFHDGAPVDHPRLAEAMQTWIGRHPDDGRYILTNGYDWTYLTVEDAPFVVRSLRVSGPLVLLALSDGTEEAWDAGTTRIAASGALYARVKAASPGGPFEAKFSRYAQNSLAPLLVEWPGEPGSEKGDGAGGAATPQGGAAIRVGGEIVRIGSPAKGAELG